MNQEFEIIVFQNHDLYNSKISSKEMAVETFIRICKECVDPDYVKKDEADLLFFKMMVCYSDRSGGDKPCKVFLIGMITPDMISSIENSIDNFYIKKCEECDKEIDMEWCLCYDCRNK